MAPPSPRAGRPLRLPTGTNHGRHRRRREDSPTQGEVKQFVIGEHNQQAIRIPGDCWHGFTVVGTEQAALLNVPTTRYDDEERFPPDTDEIPMGCDEQPH